MSDPPDDERVACDAASDDSYSDGSPLFRAVEYGDVDKVKELLRDGACDVNDTTSGRMPLHVAAESNDVEIATLLLEHGALANLEDTHTETALFDAARNGNLEVATVLVSNGALANGKNDSGKTPLYAAVSFGHIDMVKLLLENGALANNKTYFRGQTPLLNAVYHRRLEIVVCLLKNDADVNVKTADGKAALHVAASGGFTDVGKLFLDAGSSINEKDNKGETPLFVAAAMEKCEMIQLLLDTSASANERSHSGTTPLRVAVGSGQAKAVRALLSWGVSISDGSEVESLVLLAGQEGRMDVLQILVEAGASVNVRGSDGETPLLAIARWDFVDGVELIVAHGASLGGSGDHPGDEDPVILSTIHALRKLCESALELEQIFGRVVSRLEDVCLQVQERNEKTDDQRSLLMSLAGIIFRVSRLLLRCLTERKSMAPSPLQDRQGLLIKIRDAHEEIDHFVNLHGLQHDEPNGGVQWEQKPSQHSLCRGVDRQRVLHWHKRPQLALKSLLKVREIVVFPPTSRMFAYSAIGNSLGQVATA